MFYFLNDSQDEKLFYTNIEGAVTTPDIPDFSNDVFFGSFFGDELTGDLDTLEFLVVSGLDASQTLSLEDYTFEFGHDIMFGGFGSDTLIGDLGTLRMTAQSGDGVEPNAVLDSSRSTLQNVNLVMGNDVLIGGFGNDTIYGDIELIDIQVFGGFADASNPGVQSASARIQAISYEGGDDIIMGGRGNDLLIGDVGELKISAVAGQALGPRDVAEAYFRPETLEQTPTFSFGSDYILAGTGNDTVVGDVKDIIMQGQGGLVDNGAIAARGLIVGSNFIFGDDDLIGNSGHDEIYGDVKSIVLKAQAGEARSEELGFSDAGSYIISGSPPPNRDFALLMEGGDDNIYGGSGNDKLIGDFGDVKIEAIAGINNGYGSPAAAATALLVSGDDYLYAGSGHDLLVGDLEQVEVIAKGGLSDGNFDVLIADAVANSRIPEMGDDQLYAGSGNDALFGDIMTVMVNYQGGINNSLSATSETKAGTRIDFPFINVYGDDMLYGQNGYDLLVGDVGELEIVLTGGTNSGLSETPDAASAVLRYLDYDFGDDVLEGGNGNDYLFGDLVTFSLIMNPGNNFGEGTHSSQSSIEFGSDTLIGGKGNDILVGDIENEASLDAFIFATDDVFVDMPNEVIFGSDTFVFSMDSLEANGHDIVKDLHVGGLEDVLKFTGVVDANYDMILDAADVDAQSNISNHNGNVLLSMNSGSVLFETILYDGQTSVLDLSTNVIVEA